MTLRNRTAVGLVLMPEQAWLDACRSLVEDPLVDVLTVTPETLWTKGPDGGLVPNGFHRAFADIAKRTGKPFVGHGVAYSVGSARGSETDDRRRSRWRERLAADRETFAFEHYTEHLGFTFTGDQNLDLPLPIPQTDAVAALVHERLLELRCAAHRVGVENSAFYFSLGDPLDEPRFLERCLADPDLFLLLDLHNLWTNGLNLGFDPDEWLERLDLRLVEEIHVSGGAWSDPAWLRGGGSRRLDSHDDAVPEAVFRLLESVAPRCPNLRLVSLERMEGTVTRADVPRLRGELERIHRILGRSPPGARRGREVDDLGPTRPDDDPLQTLQDGLAEAFRRTDPVAALRSLAQHEGIPAVWREHLERADPVGIELSDALIAQLRLSRVCNGSQELHDRLLTDPRAFSREFERYRRAVPPTRWHPIDEAAACVDFLGGSGPRSRRPSVGRPTD